MGGHFIVWEVISLSGRSCGRSCHSLGVLLGGHILTSRVRSCQVCVCDDICVTCV